MAAFARHENAHFYITDVQGVPYNERDNPATDYSSLLGEIGGINANLSFADQILLEPYQPVASELNEIAAAIDLSAYYFVQEKLIASDGIGDLAKMLNYHQDHGLKNTEAWTAVMGVWSAADLFWSGNAPVIRILKYAFGGETLHPPHPPKTFSLKTTADLSPFGPMFGLRGYYFLAERSGLPSVVTAKIAASPARRPDTIFPFMVSLGAERIPLFDVADQGVALSAGLDMAVQDTDRFIDSEPEKDDHLILSGRSGLHLLTSWGEVSSEFRYKQEGFLPNASPKEGWSLWGGLRYLVK